jgi:hypothetical protein
VQNRSWESAIWAIGLIVFIIVDHRQISVAIIGPWPPATEPRKSSPTDRYADEYAVAKAAADRLVAYTAQTAAANKAASTAVVIAMLCWGVIHCVRAGGPILWAIFDDIPPPSTDAPPADAAPVPNPPASRQ